jgi:hypothetical protein
VGGGSYVGDFQGTSVYEYWQKYVVASIKQRARIPQAVHLESQDVSWVICAGMCNAMNLQFYLTGLAYMQLG